MAVVRWTVLAFSAACSVPAAPGSNPTPAQQLFDAIDRDSVEAVATLLQADPGLARSARDVSGITPLHHAAFGGDPAIVEALIHAGAEVSAGHDHRGTPLHCAVAGAVKGFGGNLGRYERTIALLVERGADPDKRDSRGRTPLAWAVTGEKYAVPVVKLLLRLGADARRVSDPEQDSILHFAAEKGSTEIVAWLVAYGLDPDAPNQSQSTPLHRAGLDRRDRKTAKFEALLAQSGAVDARDHLGKTPLMIVCRDRPPASMPAAQADLLSAVRLLVGKGADINAQDGHGMTPLHAAVVADNPELIGLLVSLGADPRLASRTDSSALDLAISHRHRASVEALLAAGADVEQRAGSFSPLERAILRHDPAIVDLLIARGADVNARDSSGRTPLALARKEGVPEIAERLVAAGATP